MTINQSKFIGVCLADTERFLHALDPQRTTWTFQTFDDDAERAAEYKKTHGRPNPKMTKVMHGTFAQHADELRRLNMRGAGVFVTINETDGRGRKKENIIRAGAVFVDLDGAPIEPVLTHDMRPHIVVELSPGRWHAYWRVNDVQPSWFEVIQKQFATKFNGDRSVHDLSRVMRVPGFLHNKDKNNPFVTRVVSTKDDLPPYGNENFPIEIISPRESLPADETTAFDVNRAALQQLKRWVPKLFPNAILYNGGYRVTSAMLRRDLEEDLGLMPEGIKDFGLRDQPDETREGKRTPIDIVMEYGDKDYAAAEAWLREQLDLPQREAGVSLDDFYAYMPRHTYIFVPTGEPWPASSVNARVSPVAKLGKDGQRHLIPANRWLDEHRPVEQMIWAPGLPTLIKDRLVAEGGWIERPNVTSLNLYRRPTIQRGDATKAGPWLEHVHKVYPKDAEHLINYFAQRVQQPEIKPNHAIVLGGAPGIGKDSILEPVKHAVGPWNFAEVTPGITLGRFNGYVKSTIIRVSEARDLGEIDRYSFYEHMKTHTASPPDVIRCDEKNLREHAVFNCCGVVITTNYKSDGIYLPPNDRRHYVAWSDLTEKDFPPGYWKSLWDWYADGGSNHVAAYLHELDLSSFDPKAPPLKTDAFWAVVDAHRAPENAELADALEKMGNPPAVTVEMIKAKAETELCELIIKNRRAIPHRLESAGYVPLRNPNAADGYYRINQRRQPVYVKADLSSVERFRAADELVKSPRRDEIPF